MHRQYLSFRIAGEEYAVDILRAREILAYGTVTRVPQAPPTIRGVLNLRGRVVPVCDLAVKFGLPESQVTSRTCVVIVEVALSGEETLMGIMVDAVNQVLDLDSQAIQAAPPFGTRARLDYLVGMAQIEEKFVLVLNIDRLLSVEELQGADALVRSTSDSGLEAGDTDPAVSQGG